MFFTFCQILSIQYLHLISLSHAHHYVTHFYEHLESPKQSNESPLVIISDTFCRMVTMSCQTVISGTFSPMVTMSCRTVILGTSSRMVTMSCQTVISGTSSRMVTMSGQTFPDNEKGDFHQ